MDTFPLAVTRILSVLLAIKAKSWLDVVPRFFTDATLLPPCNQALPVLLGRLCEETTQFVPLLMTHMLAFASLSVQLVKPSIVWADVVAMVNTGVGTVVLA